MKVCELIENLRECNCNAEVLFYICDEHGSEYKEISYVDPLSIERRHITKKVVLT